MHYVVVQDAVKVVAKQRNTIALLLLCKCKFFYGMDKDSSRA